MDDEFLTPIATQPEDLYADLREQTAVARLSEGLLAFAGADFAAAPMDELEPSDPTLGDPAVAAP
jgi:hypothetical protein